MPANAPFLADSLVGEVIETKEMPATLAEMDNRPASFDFFPESQPLKIRAISHITCDFGDFP